MAEVPLAVRFLELDSMSFRSGNVGTRTGDRRESSPAETYLPTDMSHKPGPATQFIERNWRRSSRREFMIQTKATRCQSPS
jgi:hypothetical protein